MIIDSNLVLFEGVVASGNGDPIALNSLQIPGKSDPILIVLKATEALAGATSVTVKLQQSDTQTGTYSDVAGSSVTIPAAEFIVGQKYAWKYLPRSATKQWFRLNVAVTGTPTAGKLFACVSGFQDEPYEAGQYINKGEVVG